MPERIPLTRALFYRVAWPTGLGAHIPVCPQPTAIIPDGGSIMNFIHTKSKARALAIFLRSSFGRKSHANTMLAWSLGRPWMADTKPERKWHLGQKRESREVAR
ncbi:hypothetical protein A6V27_05270 [Hafnia alvei]|nr:hypothetical protein A6V27_05270 [Hafnia alvei]